MELLDLLDNKKLRRFFSTKRRIIVEGGIYHITQRAPGRERLFVEEKDYLYFLYLLKQISAIFKIDIYAFVLMPNHIHLLVHLNERNLDKAMKKLFQRYAIYFNKKYQRKGHVFCGVYRSGLCNEEGYVISASLYIHLNPLKAGIVDNIYEYSWSSLKTYLNSDIKSFVKQIFVLNLLSSDKQEAAKKYRIMLEEGSKLRYKPRIEVFSEWTRVFRVLLKMIESIGVLSCADKDKSLLTLEEKIKRLKNKKRLSLPHDREALIYTIEQLKSRGFNVNEISQILAVSRFKIYRLCNRSSSELKMLHKKEEVRV